MKVIVLRELCMGHAQCEDIAPDVFSLDDEGIAVVLQDDFPESFRPKVEQSIRHCPTNAILIGDS